MLATLVEKEDITENKKIENKKIETITITSDAKFISWEDFSQHPPERMEWVDGYLLEKTNMTFKHGFTQAKLALLWGNYLNSNEIGGAICTETLCKTKKQARRPDVAYVSAELMEQFGNSFTVLPQSFPLVAEVASPEDSAEMLFTKSKEYLESGGEEVWLIFPETEIIIIGTSEGFFLFNKEDEITTKKVLNGFKIIVKELFL